MDFVKFMVLKLNHLKTLALGYYFIFVLTFTGLYTLYSWTAINTAQNNQVGHWSPQYTCLSHRMPVVSADIHTVY